MWLVAVLGAAAILVGPITPWTMPVEVLGTTTCLAGTIALALWIVRR
jgi:hypothetical protein